jgi:hypothetical protein
MQRLLLIVILFDADIAMLQESDGTVLGILCYRLI